MKQKGAPCYQEFVYTAEFADSAEELLNEEQLRALETELLRNPEAGRIIVGTGACAKCGFPCPVAARVAAREYCTCTLRTMSESTFCLPIPRAFANRSRPGRRTRSGSR